MLDERLPPAVMEEAALLFTAGIYLELDPMGRVEELPLDAIIFVQLGKKECISSFPSTSRDVASARRDVDTDPAFVDETNTRVVSLFALIISHLFPEWVANCRAAVHKEGVETGLVALVVRQTLAYYVSSIMYYAQARVLERVFITILTLLEHLAEHTEAQAGRSLILREHFLPVCLWAKITRPQRAHLHLPPRGEKHFLQPPNLVSRITIS